MVMWCKFSSPEWHKRLNLPAQEPLGGVLEGNENTNHRPVASPLLQLLFIQRALLEGFESRVGWEEKSKQSTGE